MSMPPASSHAAEPMSLQAYMALSGPAPDETLRYGDAPSQYVELTVPDGTGPFPVAVLVHGGCWVSEFGGITQFRDMAGALVAQGIAVWNVEYRRNDEAGGGYPGVYQDIDAALALLARQARRHRIDPARLVAIGHSAGGHLVRWAAGRDRLPPTSPLRGPVALPVRQVISLGTAGGNLRTEGERLKGFCGLDLPTLTGQPGAGRSDVFADTNPSDLLPNGSHTVLINGELDRLSPPSLALEHAALIRQAGDSVETLALPGASHFDEVATRSPAWQLILPVILRLLGLPAGK